MQAFTPDPDVIAIGKEYLYIVGAFYIVYTSMFVNNGVMRGAGDTVIPMFITLVSLWIIRIPLAWWLSYHYGYHGIWWSVPIAWAAAMILSYTYYKTGRWKKKSVIKKESIATLEP
jgi:Na+-driven multidrug efflux pump